VYMCSRCVSA